MTTKEKFQVPKTMKKSLNSQLLPRPDQIVTLIANKLVPIEHYNSRQETKRKTSKARKDQSQLNQMVTTTTTTKYWILSRGIS